MEIKNKRTIIITDPCYIVPNEMWTSKLYSNPDSLKNYGFTDFIWGSTIYGDWSCTTLKIHKSMCSKEIFKNLINDEYLESKYDEEIGQFCADSGLVGVFFLDEVLKFNPEYKGYEKSWTTTVIKDFTGKVERVVIDDCVSIIGTGSDYNFLTYQSGL